MQKSTKDFLHFFCEIIVLFVARLKRKLPSVLRSMGGISSHGRSHYHCSTLLSRTRRFFWTFRRARIKISLPSYKHAQNEFGIFHDDIGWR